MYMETIHWIKYELILELLDKKRSVILPATSIPYQIGAGFSYEIGKHAIIKSQTNYQYNIIQKKWEWFFGAGVSFTF